MDSDVESVIEDRLEPDLEQILEPDQQEHEDNLSENGDRHSEGSQLSSLTVFQFCFL